VRLAAIVTLLVLGVSLVMGAVIGAAVTADYRGYVFSEPATFAELGQATALRHATPFYMRDGGAIEPFGPLRRSWVDHPRLVVLRQRKLLLTDAPVDTALDVAGLVQSLWSANVLRRTGPLRGEATDGLSAVAIEFDDGVRQPRLLVVAMSSHPSDRNMTLHQEVLLTRKGSGWEVVRAQRFYREPGLEGPRLLLGMIAFCAAGTAVVLSAFAIPIGLLAAISRRRRTSSQAPPPLPSTR
jgi:hypothetical protein